MDGTKNIFTSKTFWGALLGGGAAVAAAFGINIEAGVVNELTNVVVGVVGAIGTILAIYGRVKADKKIG